MDAEMIESDPVHDFRDTKKIGRPKGSKTRSKTVEAKVGHCPKCFSTNRGRYYGELRVVESSGERAGVPYNRVKFRRCTCADCGQIRVEKSYHYEK